MTRYNKLKGCINCNQYATCVYRHIQDPCNDWKPNAEIRRLQMMAKQCMGRPMSRYDVQFIDSMVGREAYTDNMTIRLKQLHSRLFAIAS